MLLHRKAGERGHFDHGWLDTYHTFAFADYFDPNHVSFRALRVMNEDRVAPGQGFGMHGHRDMEIITYVLAGALQHRDSLGNGAVLRPGELQHMTAGTGVQHSEFNPSAVEPVHLYQIWLLPGRKGLTPGYEQQAFAQQARRGKFQLVASRDGRDSSLSVRQDVDIYLAELGDQGDRGERDAVKHVLAPGRHAWVQVLRGTMELNGLALEMGDGVAVSAEADLRLTTARHSEVMVFDLA
jgi:redox-sensitive bicupin YhaK (pirin superfamily)